MGVIPAKCLCGSLLPSPSPFPRFSNGRRFSRCRNCGQGCLLPLVDDKGGQSEIYQRLEYMEYLSDAEAEGIAGFFLDRINELGIHDKTAPILDFGAGRCSFQHFFAKWGWTAFESLEPNAASLQAARNRYGLAKGLHDSIDPSMIGKYEVVIANMVLEHLHDPAAVVRNSLLPLLRHGGRVIMTVPNVDSLNRLICGRFWIGYSPDQHNWFFGRRSAAAFSERACLSLLQARVQSPLFSRRDGWRPTNLLNRFYKHTVMRFAEAMGRGDQLVIIAGAVEEGRNCYK